MQTITSYSTGQGARLSPPVVRHSQIGVCDQPRSLPPYARVAFMTSEGRLALENEGVAPLVPAEGIEPDLLRRAISRHEAILRPTLDERGGTLILAYLPAKPVSPDTLEARAPAVFLTSLSHQGEAVKQIARNQFGMSRLAARVCAALVETGSLRRASAKCGVTYQTAQSEMADAMQAAGVNSQSALVCQLAEGWLSHALDTDRTASLLMTTFGLKPRDARITCLLAAGLNRGETAARLGASKWAVKSGCTRIFSILGVAKAPELTRVVIDLVLADDLATGLSHGDRR